MPARRAPSAAITTISFRLRDDRMVLAVGDISGKGISAALLMATVHAFVRAYSLEPEQTLAGRARRRMPQVADVCLLD